MTVADILQAAKPARRPTVRRVLAYHRDERDRHAISTADFVAALQHCRGKLVAETGWYTEDADGARRPLSRTQVAATGDGERFVAWHYSALANGGEGDTWTEQATRRQVREWLDDAAVELLAVGGPELADVEAQPVVATDGGDGA